MRRHGTNRFWSKQYSIAKYSLLAAMLFGFAVTPAAWSVLLKKADTATSMTSAASELVDSFSAAQKSAAVMEYGSEQRTQWHFIPKKERKGVQLRDMSEEQRRLAHDLLQAALSKVGYHKAEKIMEIESLLALLEGDTSRFKRDPLKYYVTFFGEPSKQERWGLSFEGHHLSLNFVVEGTQVVSSTPQFFGANPAVVKEDYEGSSFQQGTRILAREETLAFDLVNSLDEKQAKIAILADKAPAEIRAAGEAQPPQSQRDGIAASKLTKEQEKTLQKLVVVYANAMPYDVATKRLDAIAAAGFDKVRFAWAGPTKPGIGHYYRVQGPTFLIEFVNTQPDAAGNPANHIHCVWRDMAGDFGLPIAKK